MDEIARKAGSWLRRRAEDVAVALLAAMFVAFIIQIVFRYLFNFPIGWTSELTVTTWLWIVLWGAAFVLRERWGGREWIVGVKVRPRNPLTGSSVPGARPA